MAKKKLRRPASMLVADTHYHNRPILEQLSIEDRRYLSDVARALRQRSEISVYAVATNVKEELGLSFSRDALARVLKGLRDAK